MAVTAWLGIAGTTRTRICCATRTGVQRTARRRIPWTTGTGLVVRLPTFNQDAERMRCAARLNPPCNVDVRSSLALDSWTRAHGAPLPPSDWLEDTRAPKERQTAAAAQSKSGHHQVSPAHVMDAAWLRTIQAVYPSLNQIKDAAEPHAEHRHPCSQHHIPQAVAPAFGRPC